MSDIAIRVEGLGKKYRRGVEQYGSLMDRLRRAKSGEEFWALKDVSFEVKQGEVLGIIGRNGAGKTTLLKLLSRITRPTAGRAEIYGRVGSLLEVGTGFHPELTGRENIYLNGAILGMRKHEIDRKFDEIVAFAETEKFIDTPVKRYSSGMYVRLAFSVAAHLEPEIMLVDEVLAVGDLAFQAKCLGKMENVAREGRTILFVSHNMGAIQALCQRGIFLQRGIVAADCQVAEAIGKYLKSLEASAVIDVQHRSERRGRNKTRLVKVEISTDERDASGVLVTGRPALFKFYVSDWMPDLECQFNIYDEWGQAIVNFNSAMQGTDDVANPSGENKFVCKVDELLLFPGRYRINVAIRGDGELQDHVEGAAIFRVEQGTLRGRVISGHRGPARVCLRHRWVTPPRRGQRYASPD